MENAAERSWTDQGDAVGSRFFVLMAIIMSMLIVFGFSFQAAMGRSSIDAAWPYHLHGMIFMAWLGLYLVQHASIATGHRTLHIRLGTLAYLLVPAMVAAGGLVIFVSLRSSGGPFFFGMNEFLFGNSAVLVSFTGLAIAALKARRKTGWHRRLMLCAMAILTGPAIGRLLPLPLVIPFAWIVATTPCLIFPVIGMMADKRKRGTIHPAYFWGAGVYSVALILSLGLAHTDFGYAATEWFVEGSPGAERPMEGYIPAGAPL